MSKIQTVTKSGSGRERVREEEERKRDKEIEIRRQTTGFYSPTVEASAVDERKAVKEDARGRAER